MNDETSDSDGFRVEFLHDERGKLIKATVYSVIFTIFGFAFMLRGLRRLIAGTIQDCKIRESFM